MFINYSDVNNCIEKYYYGNINLPLMTDIKFYNGALLVIFSKFESAEIKKRSVYQQSYNIRYYD